MVEFLQEAQQIGLNIDVEVADLVEKQRAAVGRFDEAMLARGRAGEGALFVTEELGGDQIGRQRRAIDGNEWPRAPQRMIVDRLCRQFLARAAFAGDQDRRLGTRHATDHRENPAHRRAVPHHILVRARQCAGRKRGVRLGGMASLCPVRLTGRFVFASPDRLSSARALRPMPSVSRELLK